MITLEPPTIPRELVSTRCSNCGYVLEGIAPDIVCPECGRAQRPDEVVLYGWARGKHEQAANAKPSRLLWVFLGTNLWLIGYGALIGGWIGKLNILLGLTPFIGLLVTRRESLLDGKIQVRLTPAGCVQYDTTAGRSPVRELIVGYRWIILALAMVLLLVWAMNNHAIGQIILCAIGLAVAAIIGIGLWRESRAFHAARRLLADNAIIDANAVYYRVVPWERVGSYTLKPLGPGRHRLSIEEAYRYRVSTGVKFVDAEIELAAENEAALRALIDAWKFEVKRH